MSALLDTLARCFAEGIWQTHHWSFDLTAFGFCVFDLINQLGLVLWCNLKPGIFVPKTLVPFLSSLQCNPSYFNVHSRTFSRGFLRHHEFFPIQTSFPIFQDEDSGFLNAVTCWFAARDFLCAGVHDRWLTWESVTSLFRFATSASLGLQSSCSKPRTICRTSAVCLGCDRIYLTCPQWPVWPGARGRPHLNFKFFPSLARFWPWCFQIPRGSHCQ